MIDSFDFAGVIFDCDGTLADTMPLHFEAWNRTLEPFSIEFSQDLFYELGGVPSTEIVRILNERHQVLMDPGAVAHRKEQIYVTLLPQAKPIDRIVQLVHRYSGHYPMAVASGGIRPLVEQTLDALGIGELFQVIATAEDVERGKPHPDLFLFAARGLGVPAERCLVYEDSPLGLEAARKAGMRGIDIRPLLVEEATP